ncbi:MAG TPA: hypothetical protein VIE43_14775 [Thermoanaerobaculia bacterium]|jgi:hypothetical protein|nr:hypothetical protein [Thermoanaerobaculia bacterium]
MAEKKSVPPPPSPEAERPARQGLISKVVPDPAAPPLVWLMSGYLGDSSRAECARLYLSPDFSLWLDIPEEAIVHTEPLPSDANFLGAVLAWVRRDARLLPGYAGARTA